MTPILFLDIDDVLCLRDGYSGFDAALAVNPRLPRNDDVLRQLFSKPACEVLRQLHASLQGKLCYVISSTWRESFSLEQLQTIFRIAGLEFVAEALHAEWCTPTHLHSQARESDIFEWLDLFHQGEPFAILDDTSSGVSLRPALVDPSHTFFGRVVLCQGAQGLKSEHLPGLLQALRTPTNLELR